MKTKNILTLITFILITQVAGIVGSLFTTPSIQTWFANLEKPLLNPPNWVFAPVWTLLFLLMAIAAYLIYTNQNVPSKIIRKAIIIFSIQLILNVIWSILFFGIHNPAAAFFEIIILWSTILYTIILFYKISRIAGWILIPYILWVSFASYLNLMLWILN